MRMSLILVYAATGTPEFLSKLLDIIVRVWKDSRKPRHRLAKAVMALYVDMVECDESYVAFRTDTNDVCFNRGLTLLKGLVYSLANLENRSIYLRFCGLS